MAINTNISGIKVDSAADDNKVPVYDATSNSFLMETPWGGGSPAGSDTEIQFNNSWAFWADSQFAYDDFYHRLYVNNIDGQVNKSLVITSWAATPSSGAAGKDLYISWWAGDGAWARWKTYLWGWYENTEVWIYGTGWLATLNMSLLSSDRTYSFPNNTGTFEVWDYYSRLASDFTVTNSSTLATVTGFTFAALAWERWYVKVIGFTTANNTTGDIKADLVTTGTWTTGASFANWHTYGTSGSLVTYTGTPFGSTTLALNAPVVNNGDGVSRGIKLEYMINMATSWDVSFQIANNSAASWRDSTMENGSVFFARKLS